MWRGWGTLQNFFWGFIDELKKQIIIEKLLKWANKKQNNFNIYNVVFFFKKNKEKHLWISLSNLDDMIYMIYSSWDPEQNILKLVILGLLSFYPHQNPKINFEKICRRYHHFTHAYQKSQSYDVRFLKYGVRQAEFFVILGHFLPFQPPENPENQNLKIEKNIWRYYNFTYLHHKWQSYDVWFLRYEAWRTEFFIILDWFLPFYLPNNPKNQNFEELKKTPGDVIILQMCTINGNQMMYGSWDMEHDRQIFCHFGPFLALFV